MNLLSKIIAFVMLPFITIYFIIYFFIKIFSVVFDHTYFNLRVYFYKYYIGKGANDYDSLINVISKQYGIKILPHDIEKWNISNVYFNQKTFFTFPKHIKMYFTKFTCKEKQALAFFHELAHVLSNLDNPYQTVYEKEEYVWKKTYTLAAKYGIKKWSDETLQWATEQLNTYKPAPTLNEIKDRIAAFADKTFGKKRSYTIPLYHLKEEIDEVISSNGSQFEYADCLLLLLDSYRKKHPDKSIDYFLSVCDEKIELCKKRKWGKPDKNGVVRHIKEKDEK
jgi:hypothetical protein